MKEIPLTQGQFALVDDDDYEWLSQFKWQASRKKYCFYVRRNVKVAGRKVISLYMHREILKHSLGLSFKDYLIPDHINHNGLDNRKENLRLVTPRENSLNKRDKTCKTSIYPGVCVYKDKYRTKACINGKEKFLGYFYDEIEAAIAYVKAVYGPEWLYE